jgi:hypothetical protein
VRDVAVATLLGLCAAPILLLPYLTNHVGHITPFEREWVRHFVIGERVQVLASPVAFNSVGPLVPALAAAGLGLLWRRPGGRALAAAACLSVVTALLCLVPSYGLWLPGSEVLYPKRIAPALLVAFGLGVATLVEWASSRRPVLVLVYALVIPTGLVMHLREYQQGAKHEVTLQPDDRAALAWIAANVPKDALIANNYGDSGLWIPAVAHRAVTRVHTNPFYFSAFLTARREQRADWVYVGSRALWGAQYPPAWPRDVADHDPRLRLAFQRGDARVYRVVGPPIPVPPVP